MESPLRININLLEPQPRVHSRVINYGLGFLVLAVIGGLSGYFYMLQSHELTNQQALNTKLKAELKQYEKEMTVFKPLQEMGSEMNTKSQKVQELEKMQVSYADAMMEIDKIIPARVIMVGVEIKGGKVIMTGFSPEHSQVARLLDGLKGSSRFKNVTVLASQMNEKTNEVEFTLEMDWEAEKK